MHSIIIDLILIGLVYSALLYLLFLYNKRRKGNDDNTDEEGGLPINNTPKLDLPPGICLPDGPTNKRKEHEEVLV